MSEGNAQPELPPAPSTGTPLTSTQNQSASNSRSQTPASRTNRPVSGLGLSPTQASVSMFTGSKDPLPSPALSSVSEYTSGPLSPTAQDRVFPVRSVVSVDPTATPMPRDSSDGGFPAMSARADSRRSSTQTEFRRGSVRLVSPSRKTSTSDTRQSSLSRGEQPADAVATPMGRRRSGTTPPKIGMDAQSLNAMLSAGAETASIKSEGETSTDGGVSVKSQQPSLSGESHPRGGLLTARFKHVVTDGGHMVITGRDGETLQRCEDEPIHLPGAIQSFGLLIALKEEVGKLVVRIVSENSHKIIGYTPEQLFSLDNFLDIFTGEQANNLLDHLDFIRDEDATDPAVNGPEVFMLSIRSLRRRTQKLWCAMHILPDNRDLIVCEFELEDDNANPLVPSGETPESPEDTLDSNPTPEEYAESTVNMSRPLRVLRSARKKRGETAAMEVFNIMSQVQEQLAGAPNIDIFLRVLIGVVKELTGFHRVMIYQFDTAWNGRVVAELVDPRATKDLYKGLNFPASDIPKQARDLYKLNKVRLLYDRDQETARLVCKTLEDLETPLNMSYCYLRAMSPIHIKYLAHMAVRSSMSISINAFGQLWGLIACHTYGSKGMRVSFPIRTMCRLVGDTASRNIERLSYASRLQARKLINTIPTSANPSGYIVASTEDLLKLFEADIGALSIRDETKILGKPASHTQEVLAMLEFLRLKRLSSVFATQDISEDLPDLRYPPGFSFIAGLLYVPLSSNGDDFIVFFRQGQLREVRWAGNPYEKFVKEGTEGYLEPRKSFKQWSETILGKSREWKEQEIETAAVLCLVYGKFITVWRQKEQALQSSQLTRLLLANSAHEVRTPLNAIINYLEIALEGSLDQETRDNLARSHSASKSLIYVINDLLDLTKTEEGQDLLKEEVFNLPDLLKEATDFFKGDVRRKNLEYEVKDFDHLPDKAIGDQRKVRQVLSNLISNAIQNTSAGSISIEAWMSEVQPDDKRFDVEICINDTGDGMSQSKVDSLFRELEQVSFDENDPFMTDTKSQRSTVEGNRTLGLGLAVVARALRVMNGQLRLKTEEGKGTRFLIVLGFDYPEDLKEKRSSIRNSIERSDSSRTQVPEGEVLLIHRSASRQHMGPRRTSGESIQSLKSNRSGASLKSRTSHNSQRSDVDKLIEAIQEPLNLSDTDLSQSPSRLRPHRAGSGRKSMSRPGTSSGMEKSPTSERRNISAISAGRPIRGEEPVVDSRTPVKPVRVPDEESMQSAEPHERKSEPKVVFELPERGSKQREEEKPLTADNLSVLVAEDDPINSKIIKKRLERLGHQVHLTVNGEECAAAHGENPDNYDVVLMDLQMPIVDGYSSTKMIRSYEKIHPGASHSRRAKINGRIPIFAVSASLVERELERYKEIGFDGWFLKPIDFSRVNELLKGLVDDGARDSSLHEHGHWERGGWFEPRNHSGDPFSSDTTPSGEAPTTVEGEKSFPAPPAEGS